MQAAALLSESLGVRIEGLTGRARASAERDWRLDSVLELCESGLSMTGRELEIVVGHITCRALIHRGLMCLLHYSYDVVRRSYGIRQRLWNCAIREIRWARALLPL